MEGSRMEHIRKIILGSIPDGVLKELARNVLILEPPDYEDDVFNKARINIELPNISMKIERFVDTDHWWIDDEYYTYYTPEEMDMKLSEEIAKSILWLEI